MLYVSCNFLPPYMITNYTLTIHLAEWIYLYVHSVFISSFKPDFLDIGRLCERASSAMTLFYF